MPELNDLYYNKCDKCPLRLQLEAKDEALFAATSQYRCGTPRKLGKEVQIHGKEQDKLD